ncbi:MAG: hypothetical protein ABEJ72_10110 [Candidatus Aenigmatarchaeota archaeon]
MNSVEDFLEKGKLLSPEVYSRLKDMEEEEIDRLMDSDSLVLRDEDIRRASIPAPEVEKRTGMNRDGHLFISDFTDFYLQRFEFLKQEIEEKMDGTTTTINKADGSSSVVGMIRRNGEDETVLEDKTGKLTVRTDEKFLADEVVGIKGRVITNDEKVMDPETFFFPDIPLNKDINQTEQDLKALFVSDLSEVDRERVEGLDVDYVFVAGNVGKNDLGTTVISLSDTYEQRTDTLKGKDPLRVSVGSIDVMVHSGEAIEEAKQTLELDERRAAIELLKKRHLYPTKSPGLEDVYLLEEVPDIVHMDGEGSMVNYKGTTFVSTSDDTGYVIDLSSREVEEVELS